MVTLKFLDSRQVSAEELEDAMKRGELISRVAKPKILEQKEEDRVTKAGKQQSELKPLPETKLNPGNKAQKASAAREKYHYKGHHSEGNRFITDGQL